VTTTTVYDVTHSDIIHTHAYYTHEPPPPPPPPHGCGCELFGALATACVVVSAATLAYVHARGYGRGAHTPRNTHATTDIARGVPDVLRDVDGGPQFINARHAPPPTTRSPVRTPPR